MSSQGPRRRGIPLFAILLIGLGALLLLQTTGVLPWEAWSGIWRAWPVLIIAVGINIALGRRAPWLAGALVAAVLLGGLALFAWGYTAETRGDSDSRSFMYEPLGRVETFDVEIGLGAGELKLGSLPRESNYLVEAEFQGEEPDASTRRSASGEYAKLNIYPKRDDVLHLFGFGSEGWEVSLSPVPTVKLTIDAGTSDMDVDLRDLRVADLSIDAGLSDAKVVMPDSAGYVRAEVDAGTGNLVVVIPPSVAARIQVDAVTGDLDVDEERFPRSGDTFVSPNFETRRNRIDLTIDTGISEVTVR